MKISILTTALAITLVASGAQGACGGGGWSKSASPRTIDGSASASIPAEIVDLNDTALVMSVKAGPFTPTPRFDIARFDALSSTLQLTQSQRTEISAAKVQIQTRNGSLQTALQNAQNALINCTGHCDAEGKKLEAATRDLNTFDPNHAFADRLNYILKPGQLAHLESADYSAKRQGI